MTCEYRNLFNLVNDLYTYIRGGWHWRYSAYCLCFNLRLLLLLTVVNVMSEDALDMFGVNQINDTFAETNEIKRKLRLFRICKNR